MTVGRFRAVSASESHRNGRRVRRAIGDALRPVLRGLVGGATAIATLGTLRSASAQVAPTNTWTSTSNGTWSTAGNWSPGPVTSATSTVLQFNSSGASTFTATNDIASPPFQLNGLLFNNSGTSAITLDGSQFSFVSNGAAAPVLTNGSTSSVAVALNNALLLSNDLTVNGAGTGSINLNGAIAGAGNLFVATSGGLTLSGDDSLWTGSTALSRGTLTLDYTTSNAAKLNSAGTLTFGGTQGGTASLVLNGNAAATTSQAVTSTIFNAGQYNLMLNSGSGQALSLNLGSVTRNSGSTIAVTLNPTGGGTTTITTGTPAAADTVYGNIIIGGTDFGFQAATTTSIVALPPGNYTIANSAASGWTTGLNITNDAAYSGVTPTGATTINSLRFNFGGASTFTVGSAAADSLVISSGGILLTSAVGANASTINAGATNALTGPFINTAAGTDLTITNNSSGLLTINPNIGVNTSAPQAVVKTGAGAVTIGSAAMIYSANGLFVNQGTLSVGTTGAVTAATYNNSTYALRNPLGTTIAGAATPVTLGDGTTLNVNFGTAANVTATYSNAIRVPQGSATFAGTITSGTATAVITLGGITLGDGAMLTLNNGNSAQMRYVTSGPITVAGGAAGQPTSATLKLTGGSFATMNGAWVGTGGGTTLNLDVSGATYTFNSGTAPTNITRLNLTSGRFYVNNSAGLGTVPITASAGTFITSDQNATNVFSQVITLPSTGGVGSRQGTTSFNATAFPTTGTLILNNDSAATTAITLAGNYPALTGPMTFQIAGTANNTAGNAIGATTITNGLDATGAGVANVFTLNADYKPNTASTATPASTNLLTIPTLALGTNSLVVGGTGTGGNSGSITIGNITTTGPGTNSVTKNGQGTSVLTLTGTTSTFSGGTTITSGTLGIGASSTLTAGAITGGPVGTGTLSLASGTTIRDNTATRTIHNALSIAGSATFDTTGTAYSSSTNLSTYTNRLIFAAGVAGNTITLSSAANPTYTVNNVTQWSEPVSLTGGATGFTKAGPGVLILDSAVTGVTSINVTGGSVLMTSNASGISAGSLTFASGSTFTGAGTQANLNALAASSGTFLINADSSNNLDFSAGSGGANQTALRLGAVAPGFVYSGTITPNTTNNTIFLGGGGTLFVTGVQTGAGTKVDVGLNGLTTGDVYLTNAGNTFGGGLNLSAATTLGIKSGSVLGSGTVTAGIAGASIYTPNSAGATISSAINLNTFSTTIDNSGNALTLNSAITGTGTLTLMGKGTTTIGTAIGSTGAVVVNGGGTATTTLTSGAPLGGGNFTLGGNVTLPGGGAGAVYTIANTGASTFTINNGTIALGASGNPGAQLTVGGTGASFARGANQTLILRPANGTANLGTAGGETYKVGGTAPTATNTVVTGVFGRDTAANFNAGTFLNYTTSFVPSTYTTFNAGTITSGATTVADVTTTAATVTAATSLYALRSSQNISINPNTLNTSMALTIGAGGVILNPGATNITLSQTANGTGVGQLAFGSTEGLFYTGGTGANTAGGGATISAIITATAGAGPMNFSGPGQLQLTGANTFNTSIVISGIVAFAGFTDSTTLASGPLGAGSGTARSIALQGGTLRLLSGTYNPNPGSHVLNVGSAGGTFDAFGGAVFTIDDAGNIVTNGTALAPTTFTNSSGAGNGAFNNTSNAQTINGPIYINAASGGTATVKLSSTGAFNTTAALANSLEAGIFLGSGGVLDLQNTNTRPIILQGGSLAPSTGTGVQNGVILSSSGGTLGGAGALTVNGEVVLENAGVIIAGAGAKNFNAPIVGSATSTNLAGTNTGSYGIFVTGAWTPSTLNTYTGGTALVTGGTLTLTNDAQLSVVPGSVISNNIAINGGTLSAQANLTINSNRGIVLGPTTGSAAGTIDVGSGFTLTYDGVIANQGGTGALTKTGAGTLLLGTTNAHTYTGINTLAAGAVQLSRTTGGLGDNATAGAITFTGGTLNFLNDGAGNNGTIIVGSASNPNGYGLTTTSGTSTLNVGNLSANTGNTVQFSGLTANGGTLNLTNANNYNVSFANGISVAATGSTVNNNQTGVTLSIPSIAATAAGAVTLTLGGTATTNVSGPITQGAGALSLTKTGSNVLNLNATNVFTGNTSVAAGTLNINGTITGNQTASSLLYGTAAGNSIVNVSNNLTLYTTKGATVAGASAAYYQTAGTVNLAPNTGTATQAVGGVVSGYGFMNISGGTYEVSTGTAGGSRFTLSTSGSTAAINNTSAAGTGIATGVLYVNGTGQIDHTNAEWWLSYGLGQITVADSGKIDHTGSNNPFAIFMDTAVVGGSYGVLNLAGPNAQVLTGGQSVRFGNSTANGSGNSGFVNLAAGTLTTGTAGSLSLPAAPSATNYVYYNYAGGTLKASAALASGWSPTSATTATVINTIYGPVDNSAVSGAPSFNGGLTVDTNSFAVTVAQPLLGATGTGVTQANLTVSGGAGYIGAPAVIFSKPASATGVAAAGYALVSGGVVTGIVITDPGVYAAGETPTITLVGGGATTAATVASTALNTANTSGGLTKIGTGTLTLSGLNTYAGPTVIKGGTLLAGANMANGGSPSAVGLSSSAASNLILDGGNFGYSGTTAASTDRNFTVTANGGGLDASGTTAGTFLVSGSMNPTATTGTTVFTLAGTGTGATGGGTLSSAIVNGSGTNVTNLVKTGAGGWTLTGTNTFAGTTSIQAGTLSVSSINSVNGGTPAFAASSLGVPTTIATGTIALGATTTSGTLEYTGTGETTDRVLNFAGTTGGGGITQSGTGLLKFTSAPTSTGAGAKTFTLSGSTAGTGEFAAPISDLGGVTGITKSGTGIWTLSGALTNTGTISVTGGRLVLAPTASLATATTGRFFVGTGGTSGAVIQQAGSNINVAITTGGQDILGIGEGAGYGYYQNAGTLTVGQLAVGGSSAGANLTGVFEQTGGLTSVTTGFLLTGWAGTNPNGVLNIFNGTVSNTTGQDTQMGFAASAGSFGMFNLLGTGAVFNANTNTTNLAVDLSKTTGNFAGVLNLNAGTLQANLVKSSNSGTPTYLGFNGGTLKANSANTTFITGITKATIYTGGATIDTNGFNVTVPQALTAPTGSGVTSVAVATAGAGYVGPPAVRITGGGGTGATAIATVDLDPASPTYGQLTGITITSAGSDYTSAPTVTLIGGGAATAATVGTVATGTGSSGALTKTGVGTLTLSGVNTYTGGTNVTAGTLALGANNTLASTGAVNIGGGTFDVATFTNTVGPVTLLSGGIAGSTGVLTSGANYDLRSGTVTFSAAGGLAGAVGLNKTTTGTVSLSGANTYSGPTNVTAGTLAFSAGNNLGNNAATNSVIVDGGTLSYTGTTASVLGSNQLLSVGAGHATVNVADPGGTITFAGASGAAGNLNKTGAGTLVITGTTSLGTGAVSVTGGTLRAGFGAGGVSAINVGAAGFLSLQNNAAESLVLGNSAGVLTLTGGSQLGFELGNGVTDSITLGATGTAVVGGTVTLNFLAQGTGPTAGTYTLLSSPTGGLDAATYQLGSAPSGYSYTLTSTANTVTLGVAVANYIYWTNSQADGKWDTSNAGPLTNWSSDAAGLTNAAALPGATSTVVFSAGSVAGPAVSTTLESPFTIDTLQFVNNANATPVTSVTIAAGAAGSLNLSPTSPAGGISVGPSAGAITISAPVTAGTAQTWSVDGTGANGSSLIVSGNVVFTGNVKKTGAGALTLSGTNSGAGGVNLAGGTLNINSATALGTGPFTVGVGTTIDNTSAGALTLGNNVQTWGGSFTFTGTKDLTFGTGAVTIGNSMTLTTTAGTLTVGGSVGDGGAGVNFTKAGAGTLAVGGGLTAGGAFAVNAGTLTVAGNGSFGSAALSGGTVTLSGNNTITSGLTVSGATATVGGTNTIGGAITVSSGAATFNGGNTVSGGVTVSGGAATFNAASSFGTTLAVTGGTATLNAANTIPGGVTLGSGATLNINHAGSMGAGTFAINGGTINNTSGSPLTLTTNNALSVNAGFTFTGSNALDLGTGAVTLNTTPAITVSASTLTVGGGITGTFGLTKVGAGTLTLTGLSATAANNYTGATAIDNGKIIISQATTATFTGGLTFGSANTVTTVGTLDLTNANASFTALTVQNNSASSNTVTIPSGKTLTINGNVSLNAAANGNAQLAMTGGGSFAVNAAAGSFFLNNISGTNTVNKSTLDLSGLNSVSISLGSTGTLAVGQQGDNNPAGTAVLKLASTGVNPTNTVTAGTVTVGGSSANPIQVMTLGGGANVFNTNTFNIGTGGRDSGSVTFQGAGGTFTLNNFAGNGRAALNIGTGGATTGANGTNTLDLTGHTANLLLGAVAIGTQSRSGSALNCDFSFNNGTLDMTSLAAATRTTETAANNAGLPRGTTVTINLGGGTVTIGNGITQFGDIAGSYATAGQTVSETAILNISGGTVSIGATAGTAITMAKVVSTGSTVAETVNASINISGGTTTLSGNIVKVGTSGTGTGTVTNNATVSLSNGTLDMGGFSIGSGAQTVNLVAQGGTLQNVAQINGGAGLTKTTAGTLTLQGINGYTGPTAVQTGTFVVKNSSAVSTTATLANTPITVSAGAFLAPSVAGANAGTNNTVNIGSTGTSGSGASITLADGSSLDMRDGGIGTFNVLAGTGSFTSLTTSSATTNLYFDIGSAGADRIVLSRAAAATGGTINLNLLSGTTLLPTGVIPLITAGSGFTGTGTNNFTLGTTSLTAGGRNYTLSLSGTQNTTTQTALLITASVPNPAYWSGAIDSVWSTDNGGISNVTNWRTDASGNADTQAVPGATSDVFFSTTTPIPQNLNTTLGANIAINSVTFNAGTGTVGIGGANTLTIGAGGLTAVSGSGAAAITANVALSAPQAWTNNSATALTVSGTSVTGANNLTVAGTGDTTINAALQTGGGTLTKQGTGTLTLTAPGTYTGGTAISGGTLVVTTVAGSVTGTGAVLMNNNTARLSGSGTIAGDLTVTAGTVSPGLGSGTATLTTNGNLSITTANSAVRMKINGTVPDAGYDQIKVVNGVANKTVDITGSALVVNFGTFLSGTGSENLYVVNNTTAGALTGTFATLTVEASPYAPLGSSNLPLTNVGPGTYQATDANGFVYTVVTNVDADSNSNTSGTGNDVVLSVVPEPGSLGLAALAGIGLLARRRRVARR